jgi:hypothetical protein
MFAGQLDVYGYIFEVVRVPLGNIFDLWTNSIPAIKRAHGGHVAGFMRSTVRGNEVRL